MIFDKRQKQFLITMQNLQTGLQILQYNAVLLIFVSIQNCRYELNLEKYDELSFQYLLNGFVNYWDICQ